MVLTFGRREPWSDWCFLPGRILKRQQPALDKRPSRFTVAFALGRPLHWVGKKAPVFLAGLLRLHVALIIKSLLATSWKVPRPRWTCSPCQLDSNANLCAYRRARSQKRCARLWPKHAVKGGPWTTTTLARANPCKHCPTPLFRDFDPILIFKRSLTQFLSFCLVRIDTSCLPNALGSFVKEFLRRRHVLEAMVIVVTHTWFAICVGPCSFKLFCVHVQDFF